MQWRKANTKAHSDRSDCSQVLCSALQRGLNQSGWGRGSGSFRSLGQGKCLRSSRVWKVLCAKKIPAKFSLGEKLSRQWRDQGKGLPIGKNLWLAKREKGSMATTWMVREPAQGRLERRLDRSGRSSGVVVRNSNVIINVLGRRGRILNRLLWCTFSRYCAVWRRYEHFN